MLTDEERAALRKALDLAFAAAKGKTFGDRCLFVLGFVQSPEPCGRRAANQVGQHSQRIPMDTYLVLVAASRFGDTVEIRGRL